MLDGETWTTQKRHWLDWRRIMLHVEQMFLPRPQVPRPATLSKIFSMRKPRGHLNDCQHVVRYSPTFSYLRTAIISFR
jgi:hypothetical protein